MPLLLTARNPWPVTIISFFIVFISFLVSFIVYASHQQQDLVRQDYYEEEIRFQHQLDKVQRTSQLPGQVSIDYNAAQQAITIALPAGQANPTSGRIRLYRPSNAHLDQELPLNLATDGRQRLSAAVLQPGLWKVRVEWVSDGQEYYFDRVLVLKGSKPSRTQP